VSPTMLIAIWMGCYVLLMFVGVVLFHKHKLSVVPVGRVCGDINSLLMY